MIKILRNSKLSQKKDKILNYMYKFSKFYETEKIDYQFPILEDCLISKPALFKELKYELDDIVYSLIGIGLKIGEAIELVNFMLLSTDNLLSTKINSSVIQIEKLDQSQNQVLNYKIEKFVLWMRCLQRVHF